MKRILKIIFLSVIIFSFLLEMKAQQNYIFNYDFEFYSVCPDNLGQAHRALGFFSLVQDVDYSNCNFDVTIYYPSDSGAYSGSGYMTMATYGNPIGSAEALAQNLPVPLDSGLSYDFYVMAKKADSAQFTTSCGGLYVYGFENPVSGPNFNVCVASLPGATLLGFTDTIKETIWSGKSFSFIAPFTVNAIAFSPPCASNCFQVVFMDSVSINLTPVGISEKEKSEIKIFPNPAAHVINVKMNRINTAILKLFDVKGNLILQKEIIASETVIDTDELKNGIYFISIISGNEILNKKIIVER